MLIFSFVVQLNAKFRIDRVRREVEIMRRLRLVIIFVVFEILKPPPSRYSCFVVMLATATDCDARACTTHTTLFSLLACPTHNGLVFSITYNRCRHPNIVGLHESYETGDQLVLIQEYVPGTPNPSTGRDDDCGGVVWG